MSDENDNQLGEELVKTKEQLKDAAQLLKEIQIQHCIGALILAGLVAITLLTFSILLYGTIDSELDAVVYMFSVLIGPSALFLLFLHLYELYGIAKRGEKSIPLTLDLMYFLYLSLAFISMIGLHVYYQRHNISSNIFTPGWNIAVILLCGEVVISLLIAKYIVTILIVPRLPHFFEHPPAKQQKKPIPQQRPFIKPMHVYYFRKKPDVSLWEKEDCFVPYK